MAELLLKDSRDQTSVEVMKNRSRASSHMEMDRGTISYASSVLNEEV